MGVKIGGGKMRKKFLGKKKIGERSWIHYYVTRRERNIYGILIFSSREENGENTVEWEWIDGLTKSREEAEKIGLQCEKYLVTPINMAESLDEIMQKKEFF